MDFSKLIDKKQAVLVAVSGGADSVALLHKLVSDGFYCIAAHCNFHLRGAESDADEAFVRELCDSLGVVCHVAHFDTKAVAAQKSISIEMAARQLRYDWFFSLLDKENIPCVAVAHHADDAAETFFLNLLRGTGLKGLTGMKMRQGRVVRPLLHMSRQGIELYCRAHKLKFRTDSSNLSDAFVRNRIRHHIVPVFKDLNPSFLNTMRGNMRHLTNVYALFEEQLKRFIDECVTEFDGQTLIPIEHLEKLANPEPFLYEIFFARGFSPRSVGNMARCVKNHRWGRVFFAPGLRAVVDRYNIILQPWTDDVLLGLFSIEDGQDELFEPLHLRITRRSVDDAFCLSRSPQVMHFNASKLTFPLTLRHWKQGDVFRPLGMKGFKKLSDFFVDSKLSRPQKEALWILESGGEIAAVLGMRLDDRFKFNDKCTEVVEVAIVKD